jgi:hypothetical protein
MKKQYIYLCDEQLINLFGFFIIKDAFTHNLN